MPPRLRKADCTLQEWTEHQRALERGYDAKRRARKRLEGNAVPLEERRIARAKKEQANPPAADFAFDTLIAAIQGLEKAAAHRDAPAEGMLLELETHLRSRIARLKMVL